MTIPAASQPDVTRQTFQCTADGSLWPYLVRLPDTDPQALLISLHGHYGDEYQMMTEGTYNDAFGKLRRECERRRWAHVTAWYGGNTWMGPLAESGLADLAALLRERWPGRPLYLHGGSMGGTSALVFAMRRPELIDAVAAFCPAGDILTYYAFASAAADNPTLQNIAAAIFLHYTVGGRNLQEELRLRSVVLHAERLTMPIFLSHGTADETIPIEGVRRLAGRLRELGRPVRYIEIPGGVHDSPICQVDWRSVLDFLTSGG